MRLVGRRVLSVVVSLLVRLVVLALLVQLLLAQFLLVLLRHVAANKATGGRSDQTVMMGIMSGDAADNRAFDAALGVCRN